MERLTGICDETYLPIPNKLKESCAVNGCGEWCDLEDGDCTDCEVQECFTKLAAYEDIAFTPEELTIKLAKLAEYEQAEAEGLFVRLPCKVGDTVMATVLRPFNGHTVTIYGEVVAIASTEKMTIARVKYNFNKMMDFPIKDFGKTVFLTKEAAEQATNEREICIN